MNNLVLVRSNDIIHDPRVGKTIRSLIKRYSVLALGWNREKFDNDKLKNYPTPVRCLGCRASVGKPSLVLYYPVFWMWIFVQLIILRPTVVHACDLDTVIPCYLYRIIFHRKLVFDLYDRYALAFIPSKYGMLCRFVNTLEEWFCRNTDVLIIVGDNVLHTFRVKPEQYVIIMNCPEFYQLERDKSNAPVFTLVYTSNIARQRGLEQLMEAIKNLEQVKLVIAGKVVDKALYQQLLDISNVEYKGVLLPSDALALEASANAIIILYDLAFPANPNRTFIAMMFGVPLITNVLTQLVREVDCGIVVDYNDINEIRSAIITLRDNPSLCKKYGDNGMKAALEKYNWNIMEQELYKIYDGLLSN